MSLEEKLKEYMTETPVPDPLRPENIMSSIQSRLDTLPQISDEKSFFGDVEEINAIEFLTKLQRMGLSAEDFANLLRGSGVSEERVRLLDENPFMSADELCDFLDGSGLTAQDYTKMLYLARKLWLRTQSLEHLDTELAMHARSSAVEAVQPAATRRKHVEAPVAVSLDDNGIDTDKLVPDEETEEAENISAPDELASSETLEAAEENVAEYSENATEVQSRASRIDEENTAEENENAPEIQSLAEKLRASRIDNENEAEENENASTPERQSLAEKFRASRAAENGIVAARSAKPKDNAINRICSIMERVDDTVIIDDDELAEAQRASEAEAAEAAREARLAEKADEEEQKQIKANRRNGVFKAFSAIAAMLVLMFGGYEYVKHNGFDFNSIIGGNESVPSIEPTEEPLTYDAVYEKITELKSARVVPMDASGEAAVPTEAASVASACEVTENVSDSDILLSDDNKLYYLTLENGLTKLYMLSADGKAEIINTLSLEAKTAEMAIIGDGLCVVYPDAISGNTVIKLLDKATLEEKRSLEISGAPADMTFADGTLTLVTSYFPKMNAAFTAEDYDSYLPFCSQNGTVKYIDPSDIHIPENVSNPCYSVVSRINPAADEMLLNISACMVKADAAAINGDRVMLAENSYPVSTAYLWNADGFVGGAQLDGTVSDRSCMNLSDGKTSIITNLSTASQGDKITLYVFDESFKAKVQVNNIAEGNIMQSAYFDGDTAYIVTSRETAPLFTVDLSDGGNYAITGELMLPSFTANLHEWGEGLQLGFGFDREADGTKKSLKLIMQDNSGAEKAKLDIEGITDYSLCTSEAESVPDALYTDTANAFVGFMYSYFDGISTINNYCLAKYDGSFKLLGSVNNYDLGAFRRGVVKDGVLYAFTDSAVICADAETMTMSSLCVLNVEEALS